MSAQPHSIRVLLVDARPVVLKGLGDLINAQKPAMQAIGQVSTYPHALDQADRLHPDVILFSFFPDALAPLDVIPALVRLGAIKVLVLKGLYDNLSVSEAIAAGARGVVLAEDATDAITRAIFNVHHHDTTADRAWTGGLSGYANARPTHLNGHMNGDSDHTKIAHLTQRERELICAIVSNPSAKYISIADQLHISEHTVHNHLSKIYHKLELINRIDLLIYALKHGLADAEAPPESTWAELH
jgi:two-component system, NarL family, response regulator LiaR